MELSLFPDTKSIFDALLPEPEEEEKRELSPLLPGGNEVQWHTQSLVAQTIKIASFFLFRGVKMFYCTVDSPCGTRLLVFAPELKLRWSEEDGPQRKINPCKELFSSRDVM